MSRPPHLRIVSDNGPAEPASRTADRPQVDATFVPTDWQLPLPFDTAPLGPTVVVVPMEGMNGPSLKSLISSRRPNSAVDLRELVRFDLPGTSREDVFHFLRTHRTHYVKDPLPWHRLAARDLIAHTGPISQLMMHEITERGAECILVFVYRREDARSLASHLNRVMAERITGPWHIEEAC